MKPINNTHFSLNQDSFDDAISDFERTLQRSKNKVNLPDVTAVSGKRIYSLLIIKRHIDNNLKKNKIKPGH